jgi:hypothetical protein
MDLPAIEDLSWAPAERRRQQLIELARRGSPRDRTRALGLLGAVRHPEVVEALTDLATDETGNGWLARSAQWALAAHPEASLAPDPVRRLLASLSAQERSFEAAPILRCARTDDAAAVAAEWVRSLAPEERDQVLLSLDAVPDPIWSAWREGFDPARPSARHAALHTFDRVGSREALRGVGELDPGEAHRLVRALEGMAPGAIVEALAPFPGWTAQLVDDLALPRESLVGLLGEAELLARCRAVIVDADQVLATLEASREQAEARWAAFDALAEAQPHVTGTITAVVKGGWAVDIGGLQAFLPGSRYGARPPADRRAVVGQQHVLRVVRVYRKRGNVVVSLRDRGDDAPEPGTTALDAMFRESPLPPRSARELGLDPERVTRAVALLGGSPAGEAARDALLARTLHPKLDAPLRPRLLEPGNRGEQALAWVRALPADDPRQTSVSAALAALARTGAAPHHRALLLLGAARPDPADRYDVAVALDALGEPMPEHLADDPDPVVRLRALAALARRGDRAALAVLSREARTGERATVRAEALAGLAAAAPDQALEPLREALQDSIARRQGWSSAEVAAVYGLAQLDTDEAWTALLQAYFDAADDAAADELAFVLELQLAEGIVASPPVSHTGRLRRSPAE